MVAVVRIRFAPFLFLTFYFVWRQKWKIGFWVMLLAQFKISAAAAGLLPLARGLARMIFICSREPELTEERTARPPYLPAIAQASLRLRNSKPGYLVFPPII